MYVYFAFLYPAIFLVVKQLYKSSTSVSCLVSGRLSPVPSSHIWWPWQSSDWRLIAEWLYYRKLGLPLFSVKTPHTFIIQQTLSLSPPWLLIDCQIVYCIVFQPITNLRHYSVLHNQDSGFHTTWSIFNVWFWTWRWHIILPISQNLSSLPQYLVIFPGWPPGQTVDFYQVFSCITLLYTCTQTIINTYE